MRELTPETITDAVLDQMATTPDARLKMNSAHCAVEGAVGFSVVDPMDGTSVRGDGTVAAWPGFVRPMLAWHTEAYADDALAGRVRVR